MEPNRQNAYPATSVPPFASLRAGTPQRGIPTNQRAAAVSAFFILPSAFAHFGGSGT
jgi:hypothetical protein